MLNSWSTCDTEKIKAAEVLLLITFLATFYVLLFLSSGSFTQYLLSPFTHDHFMSSFTIYHFNIAWDEHFKFSYLPIIYPVNYLDLIILYHFSLI